MKNQILLVPSEYSAFASRFNQEDWSHLCRISSFCEAVNNKDFALAEVIAWKDLLSNMDRGATRAALASVEHDRLHEGAVALVAQWAKATGREGRAWKQSRQQHVRRLMKHGIDSDYARKMMTEAGLD